MSSETSDHVPTAKVQANAGEGGLHAPPHLGFFGKFWWWFDFLVLVQLARLRFIFILVVIGLVIVYWDTMAAYYDKWTRADQAELVKESDVEYFCPMHPQVVRDKPGEKCPICFMPLSKRKKGEAHEEALPPGVVSRVQLTPYRIVLANVQTSPVDYVPLHKTISTVGFVEFNERLQKTVAARVKGRLDQLFVNETGQWVKAGDQLASIYSPELQVTVQNLLSAQRSNNAILIQTARERLELLGISKDQIDEIQKTGQANSHLKIRSPINGHVIRKLVKEGQYVEEGMPLYEVADLSTVWIQAQIYEEDLGFLPPEMPLHDQGEGHRHLQIVATTQSYPNERFEGVLTFIFPHLDRDSRTVSVRFELPNPAHKLKPGMTATVELQVAPGDMKLFRRKLAEQTMQERASLTALTGSMNVPAMLVPLLQEAGSLTVMKQGLLLAVSEDSVIDTGTQHIVYREVVPGEYEGVLVELGPKMTDDMGVVFFPVLRGLAAGERVVTMGSFLVDAETRLNPAAGSIYFGGTGTKTAQSSSTPVRPSTPVDEEGKVKSSLGRLPETDRVLAQRQEFCPILEGSRLGSMGVPIKVMLGGQAVFVCCPACEPKAKANPTKTLEHLKEHQGKQSKKAPPVMDAEEEKTIQEALAQLTPAERAQAEKQGRCPNTGERLGSMGKPVMLQLKGEQVFLCCESCVADAKAKPGETLAKVKKLTQANTGAPAKQP